MAQDRNLRVREIELAAEGESAGALACSDEELDIVVNSIRQICHNSSLEFALRVGAVIVHHFYGGDMNAWRTRGPKATSFRRLAKHPQLPMSPGALYRCVAIFELCERSNAPSRWRHLGATHLRAVLALPPAAQERILSTANRHRWSVQALEAEIRKEKHSLPRRGGRQPRSPVTRSLQQLYHCLRSNSEITEAPSDLDINELSECMKLAREARRSLDALTQSLAARLGEARIDSFSHDGAHDSRDEHARPA